MKRLLLVSSGLALALSSVWVAAQDSPESLLPPGFEKPKPPKPAPPAVPSSGSTPVVQPLPGSSGNGPNGATAAASATRLPSGVRIPTIKELISQLAPRPNLYDAATGRAMDRLAAETIEES